MMTTVTGRGARAIPAASGALTLRRRLALLDQDQADLERARELLAQARIAAPLAPREAFELAHRSALRGAGILVARANRERKRKLPLNVWAALDRLGPDGRDRAAALAPLVAERARLDRDLGAQPDPGLLEQHLDGTAAHLDLVAAALLDDLPPHLTALAG